MAEIKTPLKRLNAGENYTAGDDGAFIIEDHHTLSDIIRHLVSESDLAEIQTIAALLEPA